jgi:peptide chain release factor subunit 1
MSLVGCRAGTSMISLVIPPKDQVSRIVKMLADEYGTASNIKSRVNRFVNASRVLAIFRRSRCAISKKCSQ